jgi:hypothetical protein
MAAVLDDEAGARVAVTSAVWWWGIPGFSARPIHLIRTASTRRSSPLAEVHRVRELPDRWTTVLDGVPVVRPELAMLHLAATEHPGKVARALDNAWSMRLLSGPSVLALLADYGKRGRNGTAVLRDLMEERGAGYVPPASNLEARVRSILLEHGIRMRLQVDSGGESWTGRVDLRDEEAPLVLEVQSERFHSALVDRAGDARRKAQLEADGFGIVEVTDVEVWGAPKVVVERVRAKRAELRRRSVG